LAEKFALATRQYAESAVRLAISGKSGIDFTGLRDQTIKAQGRSEVAFRALSEHVASHQCGEATQNGQGHLHPQSNTFLDCNAIRTGPAE
jgi:hypothetical protein